MIALSGAPDSATLKANKPLIVCKYTIELRSNIFHTEKPKVITYIGGEEKKFYLGNQEITEIPEHLRSQDFTWNGDSTVWAKIKSTIDKNAYVKEAAASAVHSGMQTAWGWFLNGASMALPTIAASATKNGYLTLMSA